MTEKIIKFYKETNSLKFTHGRFKIHGYTFMAIRNIIAKAKLLKKPGRFHGSENKGQLIEDKSREFRYLTDKDLNFENEIKSKLF